MGVVFLQGLLKHYQNAEACVAFGVLPSLHFCKTPICYVQRTTHWGSLATIPWGRTRILGNTADKSGQTDNYQEAIKWRRPRLVFDRDSECEHRQEICQERSDKTDPNQNIFKQGQQQIRWQKDAHKIIFCFNASQTV